MPERTIVLDSTQIPTKESDKVEFKPMLNNQVIEALVAFSNAKGGAVYVGISDNGKISGISLAKETLPQFINEIKGKTIPSIIPDTEIIDVENDKKVVALSVQEYPIKPVSFQGKYYKRVNASNHLLSANEISDMFLQTMNTSWDMYPDPVHTLDDISLDKVKNVMETLKNKKISVENDVNLFMTKYNLLRDGKPTLAAYLMFKKYDCVLTTIELGRFQDPITIKDTARSKSDVFAQVDEVLNFVQKHINLEVIITGNPYNTQKWQYPLEALREIVLNMIIHRDYRSSYDSIVKVYNDKIEFYNPGGLPDSISIEDLLSNNYESKPRNKKIAETFKDIGLIEKYGSGIKRIMDYFKEENLPTPIFETSVDSFKVTVFCKTTGENVGENVGENQAIILRAIKNNQWITTEELSEILQKTTRTVERNLKALKSAGTIEREGPDKGGYWRVL